MSREVKLGLLAFITLLSAVWGYKFIKGQNLFRSSNTYYSNFSDVTGLAVSSDVMVNGFKIGSVTKILINPDNVHSMDVYFRIDGAIDVPKNAVVVMKFDGPVSGKYLALTFDTPCTGADCAPSGTKLKSKSVGLIGSMVDVGEVDSYVSNASKSAQDLLSSLGKEGSDAKIDKIIRNLEVTMANMAMLTKNFNTLVQQSNNNLVAMSANLSKVTKNIAENNEQITSIISNLNKTSQGFAAIDFNATVNKTNAMLDNGSNSAKKLETALESMNSTIKELSGVVKKIDEGAGSLGMLMNDKKLYANLEATSKNLSLLLQDMRLNPKRYLNVSLIARKDKPYTTPDDDPAFLQELMKKEDKK